MPVDVSNLVAWRLMGQQQAQQQAEAQQQQALASQMLEQQRYDLERNDKREAVEFDRNYKLAEQEAKTAAALGVGRSRFFGDPRLEAVAKFGEAQGLLANHQKEIARTQQINDERVKDERARALRKQQDDAALALENTKNFHLIDQKAIQEDLDQQTQQQLLAGQAAEGVKTRSNLYKMNQEDNANAYAIALLNAQRQREMAAGGTRQDRVDSRMLSKELRPYQKMRDNIAIASKALAQKDAPGVGWLDAPTAALGLGPSAGISARQAIQGLHNDYLHALSGAAVSPSEADRAKIATGFGLFATPEQTRLGTEALIRVMTGMMSDIEAGYEPHIVDTYRQQGGTTSQNITAPVTAQSSAGFKPPQMKPIQRAGKTYWWDAANEMWVGEEPPE